MNTITIEFLSKLMVCLTIACVVLLGVLHIARILLPDLAKRAKASKSGNKDTTYSSLLSSFISIFMK